MIQHQECISLLLHRAEQLVSYNHAPVVAMAVFSPDMDVIEELSADSQATGLHVFAAIASRVRQRRAYAPRSERWSFDDVAVFATHQPCQVCILDLQEAGVTSVTTGPTLEESLEPTATEFSLFAEPSLSALSTQLAMLQARFETAIQPEPQEFSHTQAPLANGTLVDVGIVSLLDYLHAKGCQTEYSCQGGPAVWDKPYILFADLESLDTGITAMRDLAAFANRSDIVDRIDDARAAHNTIEDEDAPTWVLSIAPWQRRLRGCVTFVVQDCIDLDELACRQLTQQ
jgi:tRNA(Arg) A34 adenosine deaminase TadA